MSRSPSSAYQSVCGELAEKPRHWLVTGGAGFIGSNLVERLLSLGQRVRCLDNFATGRRSNLEQIDALGAPGFELVAADIRDPASCRAAVQGVEIVLHQAALGSVPRSVEDPAASHATNVDGFLNLLIAARGARVKRVVYASSSSVYGDDASDIKHEDRIGRPLSPYAATKLMNEVYADVFVKTYGLECVGLRYFNVFGRRQDPNGPYAAVIPRWVDALIEGAPCLLFGDGGKSRDFCYVDNVVQANLLAAVAGPAAVEARVCNVACGERTTLSRLFELLRERVGRRHPAALGRELEHRPARAGDIAHSLADIGRARSVLQYEPSHRIAEGLDEAVEWYLSASTVSAGSARPLPENR